MINKLQIASYVRNSTSSVPGKIFIATSALSAFLGVYSYVQAFGAEKEIQFRKNQLKLPIYKLTQQQLVNPPWNHSNIKEWLYRRVEVVGRPIHRQSCFIPNWVGAQFGNEAVMPLVTREDEKFQNRYGLLISLGWYPELYTHPTTRQRVEDVNRQRFVGFVSRLSELQNRSLFKGNAYQPGRLYYTSADVADFAKSSELLNQAQAGVAVIQRLHETGIYDERSSVRRSVGASAKEEYPYCKTESGALQLHTMPWEYRNEAKYYLIGSVVSFIVGASIF